MRRPSALLIFLLCCAVGIAAGLAFAWLVAPAQPAGVTPERLNPADRELYIQLIADSYAANGDRDAAAHRLESLGTAAETSLVELITRDLNGGRSSRSADNLINLAAGLALDAPVVELLAQPPAIPSATPSASAEPASMATSASPISAGHFELIERTVLCVADNDANRLEINIIDSDGEPRAGVTITVFWDGGRDSFFTGFTSDQDSGYADFTMMQGTTYSVAIAEDEVSAAGLETQFCADGREGGWRLEYQAREP